MIPLLVTLATITGYFTIGFAWSRRMLPKWWEIGRREWRAYGLSDDGVTSREARESVKQQYFWKAVCWPIFAATHLINLDRVIDSGDPVKLKREADQRERRIRQLERELGIK